MFQLSFLNAGLLILAAATILPLLIWLLARRKPRRIVFSTIRFLKQSEKEQKSRTQLKNILLLIIRMLIILLVVLAASRPSLRLPRLKPAAGHPATAVALVLDTSYSMDYTTGSKSTLEQAKAALLEINKRLTPQDMAVIVTSDDAWNRMNAQLHTGKLPDNLVNSVRSTWVPLPMDKMIAYAETKLRESQLSNREIYLLTDSQEQPLPSKTDLPVLVIPLPKPMPWEDASCTNAKPVVQLTNRQQSQSIQFDLTNYGSSVRRDLLVRLDFNGVKAAEQFFTLQPGEKLTATLPVQIMASGWQSGYVEVLDEHLPADNRCWFAFSYDLHPRVAVITQRAALPLILQTTLSVFATPQGAVNLVKPEQVNWQQLKDYGVLVVYAAGELSPRLREFLQVCEKSRKGVLYCADKDLPASWKPYYNQLFHVLPDKFVTTPQPLTYVNPYHSITSLLDARQLKRITVTDYWAARTVGTANILLGTDNSALAAANQNNLLWLFDPAGASGRFFLEASFPVFTFRSLQYLANTGFETDQYVVGQTLTADELTLPTEEKTELNGNPFLTTEPGVYTQSWRGSSSQEIAVQPDYRESIYKPVVYPSSGNYHLLGQHWQEQIFLSRLGHDIWKYLLLAALLLFLAELILVKSEEWKRQSAKT